MSNPAPYEAKTMHHPQFRKGKITPVEGIDASSGRPFKDFQGEPDVFPDVTVKDQQTEDYYRSRGYLMHGETPAPPADYSEYPVMLSHPDHQDAVADDYVTELGEHKQIIRHLIKGTPEVMPPRSAANPDEESAWGAKGYRRVGSDNPDAIRTAKASPFNPNAVHAEFPKVVAGKVIDPTAPVSGPQEYPKWIGDRLVNSRAEEMALAGAAPARPPLAETAREKQSRDRAEAKAAKAKNPATQTAAA